MTDNAIFFVVISPFYSSWSSGEPGGKVGGAISGEEDGRTWASRWDQRPARQGLLFWGAAQGLCFKVPRELHTLWTLPFFQIKALSLRWECRGPSLSPIIAFSSPELLPSLLTTQANILHLGMVPRSNNALEDWEQFTFSSFFTESAS